MRGWMTKEAAIRAGVQIQAVWDGVKAFFKALFTRK
jgi:hypothetical protein